MTWESAIVIGGLGVAGLFLWFATRQAENWFGLTMKVFFTILGLLALQSTGASTLGVIDTVNATSLNLTAAQYGTLQGGSLATYEILYYGIWVFISLFVIYYLYEIIMMLGNFVHRRRKRPFGEDGEEAE